MTIEEGFVRALHALSRHRRARHRHPHEIFQLSTINALLEGVLDGDMSYGQLKQHGNFGIGTFNALDGEMIAFDGDFWQVRGDGRASPVPDETLTPFATVVFFEPRIEEDVSGPLDFDGVKRLIDSRVGTGNLFCAVRIDGTFTSVRTRSIPKQSRPYPPLVEITRHQPEFDFTDIEGTIVGFRFPDFAAGMNVPGYHLHFLTRDRQGGGHLLSFALERGRVAIDEESDFHIELPTDPDFLDSDLGGDHHAELKEAEE